MQKEINEVNFTFGKNLALLRKNFNLSRKELAQKVDADEILIGAYERGERTPKFPRLIQFADLFGVSVDTLLRGEVSLEDKNDIDAEIKKLLDKDFVLPFFSVKKFNPETFLTLLVDGLNIPVNETSTNTDIFNFLGSYDIEEYTYRLNQLIVLIGRVEKFFKIKFLKRHERVQKISATLIKKISLAENANNEELAEFYYVEHKKLCTITDKKYCDCGTAIRAVKGKLENLRNSAKNVIETLYRHNFSHYLRQARQKQKLTQSDLSKLMGISQSGIADYEGGNRSPNLSDLKRFAKIFNLSIEHSILTIEE